MKYSERFEKLILRYEERISIQSCEESKAFLQECLSDVREMYEIEKKEGFDTLPLAVLLLEMEVEY